MGVEVMALSIAYWASDVNDQSKLTKKCEAVVQSGRVLSFTVDHELRVKNSSVQASMRDTSYKVQVFLEESANGNIKDASCQCHMGEFKYHYLAASLALHWILSKKPYPYQWLRTFFCVRNTLQQWSHSHG